jgi:hypothetical protein
MSVQRASELYEEIRSRGQTERELAVVRWEDGSLFRPVLNDPPGERSFESAQAKEYRHPRWWLGAIHSGVELFESEENAVARAVPGAYLCELEPREGHGVAIARIAEEGFFVAWGSPRVLLSWARVIGGPI